MGENGNGERGRSFVHRATTSEGREIRTVSLTHYLSTSLFLLGVIGTLCGYLYGGSSKERQIVDQFRAEVKDAKTEVNANLEREKGVAQATHEGLHKRVDGVVADVRMLSDRFIDHVARGR